MKVLLSTLNAKYIHTNLAIRLLYELNQDHPGLSWKEFTIKENKDEIAAFCQHFDVLAFSCYIWNITQTLEVARKIKTLNPTVKILLGGPEVSYEWQEIISRPEVDYIITGEGEIPFQTFLRDFPDVSKVPGLVQKTEHGVHYHPEAGTFDLTQYRDIMPYRTDDPAELYNKVLYLETSRGCPYKCEFCLASLDNKVRYLPNESLKATLLYLMQNGRTIKFLDRTFNMKRDFTLDIFKFILENHRPENIFQFEITADILHPDIIQFIQEHVPPGLFRFEIGIQTVNQIANLEVSRKQNFEKTKAIIKALEHKIEMHLDLIVGLALDTWDDLKYSFETVFKLFAPELQLGFLKFLKGTPVRDKFEQHGFVFDPNPPYQIIESNYLSKAQLRQMVLLEHALEIYWNKKRTPLTLKYVTAHYSIFDFLLALGTYFETRQAFHQYKLDDVFDIAESFINLYYPSDPYLMELLGIDYYLFHKSKPKPRFFPELDVELKNQVLGALPASKPRSKFIVLPISFDFAQFNEDQSIRIGAENLVIEYAGHNKAILYQD
ncbi:MAG: DUF4080 domain-containing protein [Bacteroidota bacterium]